MTSMIDAGFNSGHLGHSERSALRLSALQSINPADYDKNESHHELHAAIATCTSDVSADVRKAVLPAHELLASNGIKVKLPAEEFQALCDSFIKNGDNTRFSGYCSLARESSNPSFTESIVPYMNSVVRKNSQDSEMFSFTSHALVCAFALSHNADNIDLTVSTIDNLWDTYLNSDRIHVPNAMVTKATGLMVEKSAERLKDQPDTLSKFAAIVSYTQNHYEALDKDKKQFEPFTNSMKKSFALLESIDKTSAENGKLFGDDLYASYRLQELMYDVNESISLATERKGPLRIYREPSVRVYGLNLDLRH